MLLHRRRCFMAGLAAIKRFSESHQPISKEAAQITGLKLA
ncbi:Hypothetical protein RAK1035_1800 [Roseovarius sp. AK1035]|nr:Hypothetical protein RAK1035_1800 [Roseovarius sp. AK1035]